MKFFKETIHDIIVTWSTRDNTKVSICKYGTKSLTNIQANNKGPTKFVDGGKAKSVQYIHRVSQCKIIMILV